jgi:glycosyltransferase involved in cell wall biosynthesis
MTMITRTRSRVALIAAGPDRRGGQSVQAGALAESLRLDGHAVEFIPIDPAFPAGLRWARGVRFLRTLLNEALYVTSLRALRRAEVVFIFSASYWSFLLSPLPAMLAGRLMKRRVVLVYHSGEADDHLSRWGALVHPWLRLAEEIVVPSPYLRDVFSKHGYRARVIRNVVDTSRFSFKERSPLRPRLISTRNLESWYRVDNTLRAFALLRERRPEATLTIAGTGREEASLRRLAGELGHEGIHFAGDVPPGGMPALYADADIAVNSSILDNQPVSILEAFAAGLPVVSTPVGDIPSMLRRGEAGLLVPPDDPRAMAEAVGGLLEDPERARRIARSARSEIEGYTWPGVREAWERVFAGGTA